MGTTKTRSDSAAESVDFLEICFVDVSGIRRCRTYTRKHIPSILSQGYNLGKTVVLLPPFADCVVSGSTYRESGELCMKPDMTTFKKLPWRRNSGHAMIDLYTEDGEIAAECPRSILRKAIARLKREFNLDLTIGFETEFMLLDKSINCNGLPQPRCEHNYASQNDLAVHAEVLEDIVRALGQLDIDVIHFHPESAFGQYEIATGPANPLKACDHILLTRQTIVAIAERHGFAVSFLPKVFKESAGNGSHVHMSLSRNGVDVSPGPSKRTLSSESQYFVNGLLKHQAAWMIWTGSTPNSFLRYGPHSMTSCVNSWGTNNREALIRVLFPFKGTARSIRFEQRCFDNTANPHLGIAALILAGILGLREKKLLPPEMIGDPGDLSEDELTKKDARRHPASIHEAVREFNSNKAFRNLFSEISSVDFISSTMAVRKATAEHYAPLGTDAEIKDLFNKY